MKLLNWQGHLPSGETGNEGLTAFERIALKLAPDRKTVVKIIFARVASRSVTWLKPWRNRVVVTLICLAVAAILASCVTDRTAIAPPQIAGATFIGSAACAECHAEIYKKFPGATHARLLAAGNNALNVGCESCHGPGSVHQQSGGAGGTIVNPRKSPEACFQCHLDKRGEFSLPHTHPVLSGRVSCADCHDPHEGRAIIGGGTQMMSQNETCGKCHTAQMGPFIFEHEALHEGCTTCHAPHGSVNDKMLIARNQTLCLKCHFQQQSVAGEYFY